MTNPDIRHRFRAMIHTVFFWLKEDLSEADRATFESELKRLPEIDYLDFGKVGKPADTAERPVTDHSFDFSLVLSFKTMEDHDRYQTNDAAHDRFINTCKEFWARVVVYDTEVLAG